MSLEPLELLELLKLFLPQNNFHEWPLTSFADTVYYRAGIENYAHRGYY